MSFREMPAGHIQQIVYLVLISLTYFDHLIFKIAAFKYNFTVFSTSTTTVSTTTHQTHYVISIFAPVSLT